jgi:5-methylcytosine-specific restriction endonuclease McrA
VTNKGTLVLNASYQPIGRVCWQRAFVLMFQEKARAIELYDDVVKTPNEEFFIPAVLVLGRNVQPKRKMHYSKRLVLERDNYVCQYCRKTLTTSSATIDHVLPRSRGGKSTFENTVAACGPCNSFKSDTPLNQTRMRLIREPKRPYIHPLRGKITNPEPEWKEYLAGII